VVSTLLSGTDASAFTLGQMALGLPPGKDALLDITFRPVLPDARAATLTLSACPTCDPVMVQLQGTGTSSSFSVSPDTVEFGRLGVGAKSHRDITVTSLGTIPVWFAGVNLVAGPGSPFSITPPKLPVLVSDQEGVKLGVDYSPIEQGTFAA